MSAPNSPLSDVAVAGGGGSEHPLVDPPSQLGAGRTRKARAIAARGVGGERELADHEQAAAHGRQIEVHLAGGVAEDAQPQHLVDELVGDGVGVVGLGADEEEQAPADPTDDPAFDLDPRLGDALQEGDHRATRPRGPECAAIPPDRRVFFNRFRSG